MRLIRIPIGTTLNDKNSFIEEFLRVFPNNTVEHTEDIWNRQASAGVYQIILDVDTGIVTQVMRVGENGGTYWELSSRYLKNIPIIYDFKNEESTPETYTEPTVDNSIKPQYNVDDILDIITEKGYDVLTNEEKLFLSKYSKK